MSEISFNWRRSRWPPAAAAEAPGVWSWCCVICTSCAAASLPGSICNARVNWFSAPAMSPLCRSTRPRVHMHGRRRLEAHAGQPLLVAHVARLLLLRLQVVLVGPRRSPGAARRPRPASPILPRSRAWAEGVYAKAASRTGSAAANPRWKRKESLGSKCRYPRVMPMLSASFAPICLCCATVLSPLDRRAG